jgi:glycosyltransferase involved in cell wall biosynthesis
MKNGAAMSSKPLVSVVVPAFNEAPIVERHLDAIRRYLATLEHDYRWELIFVDDGSTDGTGRIAGALAAMEANIHVIRHETNLGLGQALRDGFALSHGDYVVTLDFDLSYSLEHVGRLLAKIRETKADVVLASAYSKEGRVANVPWLRRSMSRGANLVLSLSVLGRLSTLTCMVRAYDGEFARRLEVKSAGAEINPEIIYRAMVGRARIEEIPASLDWGDQKAVRAKRPASRNMLRQTLTVLSLATLLLKHSCLGTRSQAR